MINILEKKEKIVTYLRANGPTLPVTISKVIEMDPFFASAILSEVLGERKIRASHMRIGSSPLYFLEGQENMLEKMSASLRSIERETFEKLKERKILKDSEETPATRVALRSIKDFAVPFKLDDQIMWRYAFFSEDEVRKMLTPKPKEPEKEILKERVKNFASSDVAKRDDSEPAKFFEEAVDVIVKKREKRPEKKIERKILDIFPEKQEEKSEFFKEVRAFLEKRKIEFLEEIQSDKKEVVAKVSVGSDVGKIDFLLVAKNKKSVSKDEIDMAIQRATHSKMPCFILTRKKPARAIENFILNNNLVKIEAID